MVIQTGLGYTFLEELALGIHVLSEGSPSDTIKVALYDDTALLLRTTAAYTTSGEISGGGYVAGGYTLSGLTVIGRNPTTRTNGTQFSFPYIQPTDDFVAALAGVGVRGLMMYNASKSNRNIFTLDLGATYTPSTNLRINWGKDSITREAEALIPLKGVSI